MALNEKAEDNKDHTNQTGSKDPGNDDLFKHAYFRISVLFVDHGDRPSIIWVPTMVALNIFMHWFEDGISG